MCVLIDGASENLDLCGRCIAVVGCKSLMTSDYQNHIEERNGEFLFIDGSPDEITKFQNVIQKADAVIFPKTDLNQTTGSQIMMACIQNEKPFIPLHKMGLDAFKYGLDSLEGEFFDKMEAAE